MKSKRTNRWLDMQVVVATLTITVSMSLWNLFAYDSRFTVGAKEADPQKVPLGPEEIEPFSPLLLGGPTPEMIAAAPTPTLFFPDPPTVTPVPYVYIAPVESEVPVLGSSIPEPVTQVQAVKPDPAPVVVEPPPPVTVTSSSKP